MDIRTTCMSVYEIHERNVQQQRCCTTCACVHGSVQASAAPTHSPISPTHSPSVVVAVLVLTQQRQVFDEDALDVEHFRRLLRLLDQAGDDLEQH